MPMFVLSTGWGIMILMVRNFCSTTDMDTIRQKGFSGLCLKGRQCMEFLHIRFTGATLSEGSWHYQSIWNVGGGKNLYDVETREWGSTTSQGKDLRDVTYSNFFPVSFGGNFPVNANSTVEQYEHIQAISVGIGVTYSLYLNQKDVESCPQKKLFSKP